MCLAFDIHTHCLVELHVLNDTAKLNDTRRESFHQRALTAMELYGPCFCRIIDVGEHDGMCYYATSVNDGEFLKDYVERVSPMDVPQALSIIIQLADAVIELEDHARLLEGLRLSNLLVCRIDDSHVAMRILDLGLARSENPEPAPSVAAERKMAELSEGGAPANIIGCDCILRRIEAEQTQMSRELSDILSSHRVTGFSTYGEQIGPLHVNHTMSGVAFYHTEPVSE